MGLVRLFIFGAKKEYDNSIKDISVLKKGDIILTGKQSVFYSFPIQISNVLTRKIKHRFWTHAAIYKGDGKLWEARIGEGVVEGDINDYIEKGFLIRAFRHKYIADDSILDRIVRFCAEHKKCKYGKLGLGFYILSTLMPISFNCIFNNPFVDRLCHLDNAYFCSELIVDAFKEEGHPISPYDGWRVKPTDFISNPLLEPVRGNSKNV